MRRALLSAILLFGCKGDGSKQLVVFAASSLTDVFADVEREFEADHAGVDVTISTAGSQALRLQIEQGAAADVFASANAEHVDALHEASLANAPIAFTRNTLVVAVPADNPARIQAFADLPNAERIVLGGETVPVGQYTLKLLDRAGEGFAELVQAKVVSREANVRLVVTKVELGEADAAIVYRSDVTASRNVKAIEIPDELDPSAQYFIARIARAAEPELAESFIDYVTSERGQATLARHGFGP